MYFFKCSTPAVRTLLVLLGQCPVPSAERGRGQQRMHSMVGQVPSPRHSLLAWLHDDDDDDEQRLAEWRQLMEAEPEALARVYAAVVFKRCKPKMTAAIEMRSNDEGGYFDALERDVLESALIRLPKASLLDLGDKISSRSSAANAFTDGFVPTVLPEMESSVHDSLIKQSGAILHRLSRRDSMKPEVDILEGLRQLHFVLWYLTLRKKFDLGTTAAESRNR
jgi:hypothetical protein